MSQQPLLPLHRALLQHQGGLWRDWAFPVKEPRQLQDSTRLAVGAGLVGRARQGVVAAGHAGGHI